LPPGTEGDNRRLPVRHRILGLPLSLVHLGGNTPVEGNCNPAALGHNLLAVAHSQEPRRPPVRNRIHEAVPNEGVVAQHRNPAAALESSRWPAAAQYSVPTGCLVVTAALQVQRVRA
jgi:hypothetical protein